MPVGSGTASGSRPTWATAPWGTPGGPIGPNATLTFDVELMAILPPG